MGNCKWGPDQNGSNGKFMAFRWDTELEIFGVQIQEGLCLSRGEMGSLC